MEKHILTHEKSKLETLIKETLNLPEEYALSKQDGLGKIPEWTSLKHIKLMIRIEKAFSIQFSSSEIQNTKTFKDLEKLIEKHKAS